MVSSDQTNIGYGGKVCYINDALMLALTFALPLGLSVVTNIILIVIVSIRFCRMPDLQKNVKNERNNLMIFVKLSTLTGVTWILGFMYAWTNNKVLLYTFVILTPLQGVFIMFSFVCNKRVFDLYKSILFGKKKNNRSSRSTIKASVYTSDISLSTDNITCTVVSFPWII
ncbi:hypothetical protein KUTeg_013826 [Tegillarca granosa]|uniref:G-protein coupled receptors family 2 profile 2 domain-containing protein n=1 Tax=Tegillarca granosa TaxID=220873 RepID=A0ABQ9EZA3_TEGGR|nr:hypothetical protein KUTeg_013826 [Tegillarca granosa]